MAESVKANVFITTSHYIEVEGTKEIMDYLALPSGNTSGKINIAGGGSKAIGVKINASNAKQLSQRTRTISSDTVSNLRIKIPLKKARANIKSKNRYLQFPKGTNLLIVARALDRVPSIGDKLDTYKGELAFRKVGGGWHPIGSIDQAEMINLINENIARTGREREGTTEDLEAV